MIDLTDSAASGPNGMGGLSMVAGRRMGPGAAAAVSPAFAGGAATDDLVVVPDPAEAPAEQPKRSDGDEHGDLLGRYGVQPLLVAGDLLAVLLGGLLVGPIGRVHLVFAVVLVVVFAIGQLYRSRLSMSLLDDAPRLFGRWLAAAAITILFQAAFTQLWWDLAKVKWEIVASAAVTLGLILALRAVSYSVVRTLRRRHRVMHRTLILGAGRVGAQVADILLDHPEHGLHPVGFLDSDPWLGPKELPLPILGGTDALYHVLTDHDVNNVVVAFGSMRESALVDVIRTCDRLDTEIFLVPRLFELHHVSADMDTVWGMPLVRLRRAARRSRGWQVKRAFDVVVSSVALVLLSPILLIAAVAVRLEGGPGDHLPPGAGRRRRTQVPGDEVPFAQAGERDRVPDQLERRAGRPARPRREVPAHLLDRRTAPARSTSSRGR